MPLSDIVTVSIETQSANVTQAGFGVPLVLTAKDRPNDGKLVHFYTDLAGMTSDHYTTTDPAYLAAAAIFAQTPRVTEIAVGALTTALQAPVITVTPTAHDTTHYILQIGTDTADKVDITSDGSATATEIVTALKTALATLASTYHFAVGGTATLTLTFEPGYFKQAVDISGNMAVAYTGATGGKAAMEADLAAIAYEDNTWYCIVPTAPFELENSGVVAYAEANAKLAILSSNSTAFMTSQLAFFRSAFLYASATQLEDQRNAAWAGKCLPFDPGSETWKFKTLAGISPSNITPTDITTIRAAGGNFYYTVGGINITSDGKVEAGEFIDIIRGRDWFTSRLQERIYGRLANAKKLPFTDAGIAVIEAEVRGQIRDAIRLGFLSDSPAPTVTVPKAADVSTSDKTNRLLEGVLFTATLAGAIHVVSIQGTISV